MSVITLCSTYWHTIGMFAENITNRFRLRTVVELGGTGVGVDVIDLPGFELSIGQCVAHRAHTRFSRRQRRSHVKSIIIQAVAENLGVNTRTAGASMFEFFDNERGRAFAHDKTISQPIERPTGESGIARPLAHGFDN